MEKDLLPLMVVSESDTKPVEQLTVSWNMKLTTRYTDQELKMPSHECFSGDEEYWVHRYEVVFDQHGIDYTHRHLYALNEILTPCHTQGSTLRMLFKGTNRQYFSDEFRFAEFSTVVFKRSALFYSGRLTIKHQSQWKQ